MTILDVLAEAGGSSSNAVVSKITVVNLSCCKDQARRFNLLEFSKTAAFDDLPVLRAGDTIYVPRIEDTAMHKVNKGVNSLFQLISLGLVFGI